jgi:hypothetical protein
VNVEVIQAVASALLGRDDGIDDTEIKPQEDLIPEAAAA